MKTFVLLVTIVSLMASAQAQFTELPASGDPIGVAKQFVNLLSTEDFAGAVARFDDTMKAALPASKLREIWQALRTQAGSFQKQIGATVSNVQGYDVVLVTSQFQQTALDVKVVLDAQGRVAGLFFLPSQPAANVSGPPPYARTNSFIEKDFTVGHGEWQLPGTLTVPTEGAGPHPAVVLVQGSGPEDRDETIGANKPFRDLAWGLASQGVAILRYEKRTKEYASKFKSSGLARFTVQEETVDDALIAAAQLRATDGVDPKHVFVLGHSLGGMLAPRIGQGDPQIAGLIIMAGCLSRPLEDIMVGQVRYLISLTGKPSAAGKAKLTEFEASAARVKQLTAADTGSSDQLFGAPPAYWLDLRDHDPLAIAKKLAQPLLILQGGRDYQATPEDYSSWKEALGSQSNVTFKLYPKLNHLFIAGEGKSTPQEYDEPGHVESTVVTDIATWVKSH